MWKSGAERQQLEGSVSGMKPYVDRNHQLISVLNTSGIFNTKSTKHKTDLQEKVVLCNLVEPRAICWVTGEHAGDELPGLEGQGGRQRVAGLFNRAIRLL